MKFIDAVVGAVIGGTVVWVVQRGKLETSYNKGKQEGEVERSALAARLSDTEKRLQGSRDSMEELSDRNCKLENEIASLKKKLSVSKARRKTAG
ncbi:MAG: hypothetical protein ABSE00_04850 [Chitinispirillaceae bacterium]